MRRLLLCSWVIVIAAFCQAQTSSTSNPFLQHSATNFPFDKVTPALIEEAAAEIVARTDEKIKAISSIPEGKQNLQNTLLALDELGYELGNVIMKLGLIQATSSNTEVRNAANEQSNKLRLYGSNIYLNEPLYRAILRFRSNAGNNLNVSEKKFLTETIEGFEKLGMKLPPEKRKELEPINKKVIDLGSAFQRNIADARDSVYFSEEDLHGISQSDKNAWKQQDGRYLLYVTTPNYVTISENANKASTRKTFYLRYNNRAYPRNIEVLDSLLFYRNMLATKLGFRSFAEFALNDKMAKSPATVWAFQNDLQKKLEPYVTEEMKVMRDLKKQLNASDSDTVYAWDVNYLTRKLKDSRYNLNTDEVKQYFEINNTLQGMFKVYEQLLKIRITKTSDVPVWDAKVQTYEIYNEGRKAGTFYLDLYPRANKYTHFACFPISQYKKKDNVEYLPVASLVCNFPEANEGASLLPHRDVITLFHEFGHLVHALLARPALSSQGPFSVKRDFVEAPSQFLENWCWEYESLSILAKHHETAQVLPRSLFDKMKKAQNVNIAGFYMRQLFLGYLDMEYEDNYEKVKQEGISNTVRRWWPVQQVPFPEGSNFITSFGHLYGYAAGYYGYLWSRVYAQDMFSVFEKNGVMDTATGVRYKKLVLEKGAAIAEIDLIRSFLGREPNSRAFLRSLGLNE
jgi:thimet oligopeptidase